MDTGASRGVSDGVPGGRHLGDGESGIRARPPLLVLVGRPVLALVPVMWVVAYLTRPLWLDSAVTDGLPDHPLVTVFMGITVVVGLLSPCLLLPYGPASHTTIDQAGVLNVVTVLGRRSVDLGQLQRVGAMTVWGRGTDQAMLYLRSGRRFVVLTLGTGPHYVPSWLRARIEAIADERPAVLSARARALLGIDPRPSFAQRSRLAAVSFVVGYAALCAWVVLAWALIALGWMPLD